MTEGRFSIARARRERTLRRESDLMAFTVCIVLIAALSYGHDDRIQSKLDVLAIIWGTTLGLTLTQWFALTLSVWLVRDSTLPYSATEMLWAQLLMMVLVASTASIVTLALSPDFSRLGARLTAAAFLAVLVGLESRAGGASRQRAAAFAVGALAIGVGIAIVKWFIAY